MGPVSWVLYPVQSEIAPAFHITQVDLTGPFKAHSEHNW